MLHILNIEQTRQIDNYAINTIGIPGIVLMENAANFSYQIINQCKVVSNAKTKLRVIVLCGAGNNGGDGFALARLMLSEFDVLVVSIGDINKMSDETKTNYQVFKNLAPTNIAEITNEEALNTIDWQCDIIIDSLIGVGGTDNIRGIAKAILKKVKDNKACKIAIDVPTGLNADTGKADEDCFRADKTITMFTLKQGLLCEDGTQYCGEISIANLGMPQCADKFANQFTLEDNDIREIVNNRPRNSSKFDYGKVAIIAGSGKYPGAAALSANAAVKAGAGLVYLHSTTFHHSLMPEVIQVKLEKCAKSDSIALINYEAIIEEIKKMDSVVIGSGLTDNLETLGLVDLLIDSIPQNIPVLIDADALRVINKKSKLRGNIILSPHLGEFASILKVKREDIKDNYIELSKQTAKELNCIIHLKGVPSITSDGEISYWNLGGNPGMASGGSGDVLSGIIGAMLALKLEPLKATAIAAYIHSKAGDNYADKYNQASLSPSDIIEMLKYIE